MSWHSSLPWIWFRKRYRRLRSAFFTVKRPRGKYLRVDGASLAEGSDEALQRNVARVERGLGRQSFAPNWEFSYNKRGEILNLAQVVYAEEDDHSDIEWFQTHVRGWPVDGRPGALDLGGHWEAEPTEHPHAHLDGVGWNRAHGMDRIAEALSEAGIEFTEVTWDGD